MGFKVMYLKPYGRHRWRRTDGIAFSSLEPGCDLRPSITLRSLLFTFFCSVNVWSTLFARCTHHRVRLVPILYKPPMDYLIHNINFTILFYVSNMASRNWCFTLNNPTEQLTWPSEKVQYAVYQKEKGDAGTEHFQGYVEFVHVMRIAGLKKLLPTAHWEVRRGSQQQARDYAMKDDTRLDGPWEFGQLKAQGKRNDLEEAAAIVKEHGAKRVAELMPSVYTKFHRGLHALEAALDVVEPEVGFEPRPWQKKILELVSQAADDRKIVWVKDTVGNNGKSRLAVHLQRNYNAVQLYGRIQDMAYMYNKEPIVVIDVPRTQAENMDHLYAFAESLKNGVIISTKYESRRKVFKPPHVIFFTNFCHDPEKWSYDRVISFDLQCPDTMV